MNPIKLLKHLKNFRGEGQTLRKRLLAFFLMFLIAVMAGLYLILIVTGVFSSGLKESKIFFDNELLHISDKLNRDFGSVSVEGVSLSKHLTETIEKTLREQGQEPKNLAKAPEFLDSVLQNCLDTLCGTLEKNNVSGAFIILDATINPSLDNAKYSRSGLFLKNMEPNAVNKSESAIRYMRGPAHISREKNIAVLPQWQMEFTTDNGDFFHKAIAAAKGSNLPLSRLYYWSPKTVLAGDYEEAVLLTVPLITESREVLGVCGFEINAMLFKLQNSPDNAVHTHIFSMFSLLDGDALNTESAIFAGSYSVIPQNATGMMKICRNADGLSSFTSADNVKYKGVYKSVSLYPKDSAYSSEKHAVAVMLPEEDLTSYVKTQNSFILIMLACLLIFSAAAAILLSRRYISPVVFALKQVQQKTSFTKTNIQEIDDLFEFLELKDAPEPEKMEAIVSKAHTTGLFETFVENISTLSPAERNVFNLYMEGYTAKEIANILYLSINTIKTHNKRIYMKLNVESRNELMVYLNMLKEKGM